VREIRERDIEDYLVKQVKATGGIVRKVTWRGHNGAPDRMVSWPAHSGGSFPVFVELKAPGEGLEPHQEDEHALLRAANVSVIVIDSFEGVDELVERRGL
jgi:hypothetical protein